MSLTDVKIRQTKAADKVQKLSDGGSLFLLIKPNGTKLWWYRYKLDGKENTFSIGEYPGVTLQEARRERDRARELVKQGIAPAQQRQIDKIERTHSNANTLKAVGDEWTEKMRVRWSVGHYEKVARVLAADVYPKIGKLPIQRIKASLILPILQALEARGAASLAVMVRHGSLPYSGMPR